MEDMLEIYSFTLGPAFTNAYLIGDPETKEAAVIDPAWDGHKILAEAQKRDWRIAHLWYTHAHFDHFGGAAGVADGCDPLPMVALHPEDYPLWRALGGAALFGIPFDDPGPEPTIDLAHGQILRLGAYQFEVRHAPGHSPGHVMFYCADIRAERNEEQSKREHGVSTAFAETHSARREDPRAERNEEQSKREHAVSTAFADAHSARREGVLFAGDVIFHHSIGRTDLPSGDYDTLIKSIREQVLTLPDDVRILPGHMGETTVGEERRGNPFLVYSRVE